MKTFADSAVIVTGGTLVEKAGGRGLFVSTDVTQEKDAVNLVEQTVAAFGKLDIAVNNAGVFLETGPITTADSDVLDRTFAINVRGVALGAKRRIPAMLKSGGGSIVNIA